MTCDLSRDCAWRAMMLAALVIAAYCIAPRAAAAARVDIVVDSTDITLKAADDGTHTATVTLVNISDSVVDLRAAIPRDAGCTVTPDPATVKSGQPTKVTLTLGTGCETETGADIALRFGRHTTPNSYVLNAAPAPPSEKPEWSILIVSFLISAVIATLVAGGLRLRMRWYNHLKPPSDSRTYADLPRPSVKGASSGPIPAGTYDYAVTCVIKQPGRFSRRHQTTLGQPCGPRLLQASSQVELDVPRGGEGTIERRIYRMEVGGDERFRRVGEIADNETTQFVDSWTPLGMRTQLASLGTDWSFKDNWVSSVTVGSGVLVALLASSDVLKSVLGSKPEAALSLMAVAGVLAAIFVGISPLVVKLIGNDLAIPTIGGMLVAGFVTLFGAIGQITVVTWQGWELASAWTLFPFVVAVLGAVVAAVVVWYAFKALWYYVKTGARFTPPKRSDVLKAADILASAIKPPQAKPVAAHAEEPEPQEPLVVPVAQEPPLVSRDARNAYL